MGRQPGEEYKDKCVLPTVKHGGGSVMVWGCISAAGTGELQFIEGTMNANMYCDILKQRLGRRAVFQHDNDPKHTSKTTTALLKKLRVKVMDWPSMSPDLTLLSICSCGSVVEHCVNSAKGHGFDSQGTHIVIKKNMYSLNAL